MGIAVSVCMTDYLVFCSLNFSPRLLSLVYSRASPQYKNGFKDIPG